MSAPKFTPGPWEAVTNPHDGTAEVRHVTARHDNGKAKAVTTVAYATCAGTTEGTANAHLLAAAPELYAACKAVWALGDVNHLDSIDLRVTVDAIRMIRAAIAKAEGGGS